MKARVNVALNLRTGTPEVLPQNNPGNRYYNEGDVIDIVEVVIGEKYKDSNIWYRLVDGGFVWSGGVDADKQYELTPLTQIEFKSIIKTIWQASKGENCTISVIDSGIDRNNPFLIKRIEEAGSFSFVENNSKDAFSCINNHGTTMAGLICGNDERDFIGYAPMSKVISLKIFNTQLNDSNDLTKKLIAALDDVLLNENIDIVNLSLQLNPELVSVDLKSQTEIKINQLIGNGVIVICASGNEGFVAFPGTIPTVITVGVLNNGIDLKSFSKGLLKQTQFQKEIDFFLETYEQNVIIANRLETISFSNFNSSEATAIFSGIVALKKSINKNYDQNQLKIDLNNCKKLFLRLPGLNVYKLILKNFFNT